MIDSLGVHESAKHHCPQVAKELLYKTLIQASLPFIIFFKSLPHTTPYHISKQHSQTLHYKDISFVPFAYKQ